MNTIAILGAGSMGGAVLSALIADGVPAGSIRATTLDPEAARRLSEQAGVAVMDNRSAVADADIVVLAVKPADAAAVLTEIGPHLPTGVLLVSLCAGIRLRFLEERLPPATAVVRVMPNTPALVGAGMSALSPGTSATERDLERATRLMRACGAVIVVPEHQQDAVTAVSGSGPAYLCYLVEAMIEGGVMLGLARAVATDLAVQTAYGSALLMRDTHTHPSLLREQVTSPAGTTVAALRILDERAVRAAVLAAMEAVARRSAQLGEETDGTADR